MASTHKPFRELVKPGSNFEFVGRTRVWAIISVILVISSIGMLFVNKAWRGSYLNWTIDFKGGTEMRFGFRDKESKERTEVYSGDVRTALKAAGFDKFEVSEFSWSEETASGETVTANGMLLRTPSFGAVREERGDEVIKQFREKFKDRELLSVRWSGDRIFVRSKKPLTEDESRQFLAGFELEMKDWGDEALRFGAVDEATGEYETELAVYGLERQFEKALAEATGLQVELIESYAVGARAGEELGNDGIRSLFYVIALIMLYLAFRFDIRYAPGAVAALFHDAILVTGVFAVTWVDVSLTSVAALLTVIGYSVNDTVVIYDRIRENVGRLKDKKMARVINISLNETLARTLLTSLTLFVVTLSMNILGTGLVRNFAFAMNVGVIVGVYSSVFVASPVMLYLDTRFYSGRAPTAGKKGKTAASSKKK
ncbi:MAG: protein translocase subunit SecF [Proteobacteria bacterium]|nr:protein translocase subunit SecF [Pseudomonadota bacterium]